MSNDILKLVQINMKHLLYFLTLNIKWLNMWDKS